MGFWQRVGQYLATGVAAPPSRRERLQTYSTLDLARASWAIVDDAAYVREGFRRNPLVYRGIELFASAVSTPIVRAMVEKRVNGKAVPEELPPSDPLATLMDRPSTDYPTQTRFVRQMVRRLMISGEAPIYKVPGKNTGRTVELQLLRGAHITVEREAGRKVYYYRHDPTKSPVKILPERMIFIKLDDPENDDRGLSPLVAAAREIDTDNEITSFRKGFFENAAIPSGILTTEERATPEELREWSEDFADKYAGAKNAGKVPALGGGLNYQKTGATPGEIAFSEVVGLSESRICTALGISPILLHAMVGLNRSTYNNYIHARRAFWEDVVSPLIVFLADELTVGLEDLPATSAGARFVDFDTSRVPALLPDADKLEKRIRSGLDAGAVTLNEYRTEALGLDVVDDGNVYLVPAGRIVVKAGEMETLSEVVEETPVSDESEAGAFGERTESPGNITDPITPAAEPNILHNHDPRSPSAAAVIEQRQIQLSPDERELERELRRVMERQEQAASDTLPAALITAGSAYGAGQGVPVGLAADLSALVVETAIPLAVEAARTAEAITSILKRIFDTAGDDAATELGGQWSGTSGDFALAQTVDEQAMRAADSVTNTTRERLRRELEEGFTDEESEQRLRDRIKEVFADEERRRLAASHEAHNARQRAFREVADEMGLSVEWYTTSAEPCEFCRALDGTRALPGEPFARVGDTIEGADGGTLVVTYADVWAPEIHPRGKCKLRVVREEA